MKISRNDPCPCGSGKKYKRCCLNSGIDFSQVSDAADEFPDLPLEEEPTDEQIFGDLKERLPHVSSKLRAKLEPLLRDYDLINECRQREGEINAAVKALELYHRDFEAWVDNDKKLVSQTEKLFSEKEFMDLRFGIDDVRRAFQKFGYPATYIVGEHDHEIVKNAILFLADETYRYRAIAFLYLKLPSYVKTGRHLDACLIQLCACLTEEEPKQSNPFLMAMFMHGFCEWANQRDRENATLLEGLGIKPEDMKQIGENGFDKWLAEQKREPVKDLWLKKKIEANPEVAAAMEANRLAGERAALSLLEGDDAVIFLLLPEETAPWLEEYARRLHEAPETSSAMRPPDRQPLEAAKRNASDLLWEITDKMTRAVFTLERITQLRKQLNEYRQTIAAEDHESLKAVQGALMSICGGRRPEDIIFLHALCFSSLRHAIKEIDESHQA
ncbi:MAG: SEC-C domain-containing protein [Kiritimatiellae bacterium]|nr:SEC-C domain-containing protein [Kiritimatiellia bacterium]